MRLIDADKLQERFRDTYIATGETIVDAISNAQTIEPMPERQNIGAIKEYDNGMVAMRKETYDEYEDMAILAAIRSGRTGEE